MMEEHLNQVSSGETTKTWAAVQTLRFSLIKAETGHPSVSVTQGASDYFRVYFQKVI